MKKEEIFILLEIYLIKIVFLGKIWSVQVNYTLNFVPGSTKTIKKRIEVDGLSVLDGNKV